MKINNIFENDKILLYLYKRRLLDQYKKMKNMILSWKSINADLKERNPKGNNIWYFRINKQFRAIWSFNEKWNLIIFKISNHQ
jgi:plasmid maintenance system killer protein